MRNITPAVLIMAATLAWSGAGALGNWRNPTFVPGKDVTVLVQEIGPTGGTLYVTNRASPLAGIAVTVPKDAVLRPMKFRLYYNDGKFVPVSGVPSDIIMGLSTEDKLSAFRQPITIKVPYNSWRHFAATVVGFSIESTNHVHALQVLSQDTKQGAITFATLVPVFFTWIYI